MELPSVLSHRGAEWPRQAQWTLFFQRFRQWEVRRLQWTQAKDRDSLLRMDVLEDRGAVPSKVAVKWKAAPAKTLRAAATAWAPKAFSRSTLRQFSLSQQATQVEEFNTDAMVARGSSRAGTAGPTN